MIQALDGYTAICAKAARRPTLVDWTSSGNNQAFVEQRVVMTINNTLSVINQLKETRPGDYHDNAATIDWPSDRDGRPLPMLWDGNGRAGFLNRTDAVPEHLDGRAHAVRVARIEPEGAAAGSAQFASGTVSERPKVRS
jgi:hypothetical protein